MNLRSLLILLAVAVMLAVLLISQSQTPRVASTLLLPELNPDDVQELTISVAANRQIATLKKKGNDWFETSSDYPANPQAVAIALSISKAAKLEEKTGNPDLFNRIGVSDIAKPNAAGVLLRLRTNNQADKFTYAVILGDLAGNGQYVRLQDSGQSWLINRQLELPRETIGWLDTQLINIPATRIRKLEIHYPDGSITDFEKSDAGEMFPEGAGAKGGFLSSLNFAGVYHDKEPLLGAVTDNVTASFHTFDGLVVLCIFTDTPEGWRSRISATVGADTPAVLQAEADAINRRTQGFNFSLPAYKTKILLPLEDQLVK